MIEVLPTRNKRQQTWFLVSMLLALIGLGISGYSTSHHLLVKAKGATDAPCNINDVISCDTVALSQYSEVFNIPLGVWGGAYFAALLVLLGLSVAGHKSKTENSQAYAIMVVIGVLVSLVLGGISIFKLGAACLTCIGIYSVALLQALNLIIYRNEIPGNFSWSKVFAGGTTATVVVALVVGGFSAFQSAAKDKLASHGETKPVALKNEAANPPPQANLASTAIDIPISKSPYSGLGEDYRLGNDQAKVVLVEFADFQCPACKHASLLLEPLKSQLGDRALFVFRNYPLSNVCNHTMQSAGHEFACGLATMGRCAGQYGKFWQFHDLAYANQAKGTAKSAEEWAAQVGLTPAQIETCKKSPDILAKIKDDIDVANKIGVDSTPTIFINGRRYVGEKSVDAIRAEIETQLALQQK